MTPPRALVFDLGGVLIDVAPHAETVARLAAAADTPAETLGAALRERFETRPYSLAEQFQAGELDESGFLAALDALLARPLGAAVLRRHLREMLRGPVPGTPALLDRLAAHGLTLACYSNTNPVHWRDLLRRFDFMRHFAPRLASHEVGLVKPDNAVFAHLQARLARPAAECVLIDDRPINVAAAHAAGWHGLQFTDAATLARDLAALEVPV